VPHSGIKMPVMYSIPMRLIPNNGTLRCTIPKEIVTSLGLKKGDQIVWTLYEGGKLQIRIQREAKLTQQEKKK